MEDCNHTGKSKSDNMRLEIEGDEMFIVYHEPCWGGGYEEEESSMSIKIKFCPFCGKELTEDA